MSGSIRPLQSLANTRFDRREKVSTSQKDGGYFFIVVTPSESAVLLSKAEILIFAMFNI